MKTISASEANRRFSFILGKVVAGAEYLVTSHGKPVARIVPVNAEAEERARARKSLLKRLKNQPISGKRRTWTRDEIYRD
jgi:prevent-host-death family protein